MSSRTSPSSVTPAPVLLGGLALVVAGILFLGYRGVMLWRTEHPAAPRPGLALDLGDLADVRTLSQARHRPRLSRQTAAGPIEAWASRAHPVRRPGPQALAAPPPSAAGPQVLTRVDLRQAPAGGTRPSPAPPPEPAPRRPLPELAELAGEPILSALEPSGAVSALDPGAPNTWASRSHPLRPAAGPLQHPAPAAGAPPPPTPGAAGVPTVRPQVAATPAPRPSDDPVFPDDGPPRLRDRNLQRGDVTRPWILLSFDGGSEASSARAILDTLDREGVRTTLFLTGEFIRNHPDLTRGIVARGHEVGNHTDHHPHLTTWESNRRHDTLPDLTRAAFLEELGAARRAFRQVTGTDMAPFWRAPYGEVNREILRWAAEAGYVHVGWTPKLDSLDWVSDPDSRHYRSPQEFLAILSRVARQGPHGLNGAIILMHLHSNRPREERFDRGLGEVIRWLRSSGYTLVTASELAAGAGEELHPRPAATAEGG
jgi:peptidoglycan/xylan/chitin deacetylase (PgdA/CDA1 family)